MPIIILFYLVIEKLHRIDLEFFLFCSDPLEN